MDKIKIITILFLCLTACQKEETFDAKRVNIVSNNSLIHSFDFRKQILTSKFKNKRSAIAIRLTNKDIKFIEKLIIDDEIYKFRGKVLSSGAEYIPAAPTSIYKIYIDNKLVSELYIRAYIGDDGPFETPDFEKLNHFRNNFSATLKKHKKFNDKIKEYSLYQKNDFIKSMGK
jgi:hypothetical protein